MTIIIEHYPCRHPAMTALIRGAFQTDPSKAQPAYNTAVNTPLGGEPALGLAALKATSHSPLGQSTNNSVFCKRAFKPPSLPPSISSLSSLIRVSALSSLCTPRRVIYTSGRELIRVRTYESYATWIWKQRQNAVAAAFLWHQTDAKWGDVMSSRCWDDEENEGR